MVFARAGFFRVGFSWCWPKLLIVISFYINNNELITKSHCLLKEINN